jgi:hypothetical protein
MAFSRRAAFAAPVGIEWVSVNKATSETAFWQAERALLFVANQAAEAAKSADLTAVKGLFTLSAGRKTPYSRKLSSWKARRRNRLAQIRNRSLGASKPEDGSDTHHLPSLDKKMDFASLYPSSAYCRASP